MNDQHSNFRSSDIIPLPAFRDNYIWLLRHGDQAAVVDPGDAEVVERALQQHGLRLTSILITHHHHDHIGGVTALARKYRIDVFGPAGEDIPSLTRTVGEGDIVELPPLGLAFRVLAVPGHTATHVAYLGANCLFIGDTLFSAGCGRLLGGTAEQLHASLQRIAALPADTRVYSAHEYTLANLNFSLAADPDNPARDAWLAESRALRAAGEPTLPSTIGRERSINPFLRVDAPALIESVTRHAGARPPNPAACFAALRAWKDVF